MSTNQRHILLQRAVRAENALAVERAQTNTLRSELASLRAYLAKLQTAAALAADLQPAVRHPAPGVQVELVRVRTAVHDGRQWKCPFTNEPIQATLGTYWRACEESNHADDES